MRQTPRETKARLKKQRSLIRLAEQRALRKHRSESWALADQLYMRKVTKLVREWFMVVDIDPTQDPFESIPRADLEAREAMAKAIFRERLIDRRISDPGHITYRMKVVDA